MAIGVDTTKWKPRKTKGTPAYIFRNRLAYGITGVGVLIGIVLQVSPFTEKFRKQFDKLYSDPIEEIERRQMIATTLLSERPATLRRKIEDAERIDLPYK